MNNLFRFHLPIGLSVIALLVAMFYQHYLEYDPCVICVHIRLTLIAYIAYKLLSWAVIDKIKSRKWLNVTNLLVSGQIACWLLTDSIRAAATEKMWALPAFLESGSCSLDEGYWLPFDQWLPWLLDAKESCGYTPYLVGEIVTMADGLLVLSGGLFLLEALIIAFVIRKPKS